MRSMKCRVHLALVMFLLVSPALAQEVIEGLTPFDRLRALIARDGEGFEAVGGARVETLSTGSRVRRTLAVAPGRCFQVFAAGAEGLAYRMEIRGEASTRVVAEADATASLREPLCPRSADPVILAIEATGGSGTLVWRLQGAREASESEPTVRSAFRVGGSETDYIAERIRRVHQRAGRGRVPVTPVSRQTLQRSETHVSALRVETGRCYVAVAAGSPSVRELGLQVVDQFGNERAQSRSAREAHVRFCPSVAGEWRVKVKVELGYGATGLQIFADPRQ